MLYLPRLKSRYEELIDPDWLFMTYFCAQVPKHPGYKNLSYDDRIDFAILMLEYITEMVR